jgi:hypothetical protein
MTVGYIKSRMGRHFVSVELKVGSYVKRIKITLNFPFSTLSLKMCRPCGTLYTTNIGNL